MFMFLRFPVMVRTFLMAALLAVGVACGGGDSGATTGQEPAVSGQPAAMAGGAKFSALVDAARAEASKQKTVYIRLPGIKENTMAWTEEAFKKDFGIDMTLVNDPKGWYEITASYLAEYQAGKKDVPAVSGYGNSMYGSIEEAGAIADVDWTGIFGEKWPIITKLNEAVTWPELRKGCVTITWRTYVIYYNTDIIKESDAPRTWEDLADPKFKGRISAFASGSPGNYLRTVWGEDAVLAWAKRIKANDPIFLENSPAIAAGVASGEVAIGTINLQYAQSQVEKGAPVAWVIPEDGWVNLNDILCIVKNGSHPNLNRLLMAFWSAAPPEVADRIRKSEGWSVAFPDWSYGALPGQMKKQGMTFDQMHELSDKETATLDRKFRDVVGKEAYRTIE